MIEQYIKYNSKVGKLFWIKEPRTKGGKKVIGLECGDKYKYKSVRLFKKKYLYHRLCWFLYYGQWPDGIIDHLDGNPHNNKIKNLRNTNRRGNSTNLKLHREGHLAGTTFLKSHKKFAARCWHKSKSVFLGYYDTASAAHEAYLNFARSL